MFDNLTNAASSTYASTTGFYAVQLWEAATTTLKLLVGSEMAMLGYLTPWIIAAMIIAAVILFATVAMHFFKQ